MSRWATRVAAAEHVFPNAMNNAQQLAKIVTRENLQRLIYAKPEDVSPRTGKKKWVRSGNLMRGEDVVIEREPDSLKVTIINRVPYAEPRHEAGKPGRRSISAARVAHWRDATIAEIREPVALMLREAQLAFLNAGKDETL